MFGATFEFNVWRRLGLLSIRASQGFEKIVAYQKNMRSSDEIARRRQANLAGGGGMDAALLQQIQANKNKVGGKGGKGGVPVGDTKQRTERPTMNANVLKSVMLRKSPKPTTGGNGLKSTQSGGTATATAGKRPTMPALTDIQGLKTQLRKTGGPALTATATALKSTEQQDAPPQLRSRIRKPQSQQIVGPHGRGLRLGQWSGNHATKKKNKSAVGGSELSLSKTGIKLMKSTQTTNRHRTWNQRYALGGLAPLAKPNGGTWREQVGQIWKR